MSSVFFGPGLCTHMAGTTILIADDSAVARLTLVRRVRARGLSVVEHDSVASTAAVDPQSLACALLDFDLGDGFGIDVAARLRAARHDLPIAFFTSMDLPDVVSKTEAFGPVFSKPEQIDEAVDWAAAQAEAVRAHPG
jgi:CheY-like chemotaxis protein